MECILYSRVMKKKIKAAWENNFFKGGIFITGSSFVINFFNYLFNSIVGRSLGPEGLSEIAALFSYLAIFSIPISIISMIVIQRISSAPSSAVYARQVELYFISSLKKYWFLIVAMFCFSPFLSKWLNLSNISAFAFVPILILTIYFGLYQALMQGLQLFTAISIFGLIITGLKLTGAFVTFFTPAGYIAIVAFFLISLMAASGLGYYEVHKVFVRRKVHDVKALPYTAGRILQNSQFIVTVISVIALTLFNNIDIVFVRQFLTAQESGLYNSWSIFSRIVFYVIGPTTSLSFVYFAQGKEQPRQDKVLLYSLVLLGVFGIVAYIGYTMFASYLVKLVFGEKFLSVTPLLGSASIFGILYSVIIYLNNFFLARRSRFALILPIIIPVYVVVLLLVPRSIEMYVKVNIANAVVIIGLYLVAVVKMIFIDKKSLAS